MPEFPPPHDDQPRPEDDQPSQEAIDYSHVYNTLWSVFPKDCLDVDEEGGPILIDERLARYLLHLASAEGGAELHADPLSEVIGHALFAYEKSGW